MKSPDQHGSPEKRSSHVVLSLVLVVASTLSTIGLAELALRILSPRSPAWLAIYRRHPELPFHALMPGLRTSIDTGETHWSIVTNADGFRVGDEVAPVNTQCTALWLGDSFAFGHGVDYVDSIVGEVQARTPGVLHINTAVPGYGPIQYRSVLEYSLGQGLHPDVVYIVSYVGNDFHDCVWNKDVPVHEGILGHEGDLNSWLKANVRVYQLAAAAFQRTTLSGETPYGKILDELADPDAWTREPLAGARRTFETEMSRIQEIGRSNGVEVRFVILPTQVAVDAARTGGVPMAARNPMLPVLAADDILQGLGASVLDVTNALAKLPPEGLYLPSDGHLTPAGNAVVAEAVLATWPSACPTQRPSP